MSYIIPKFRHPSNKKNKAGLTLKDYEGAISTLCAGCGHDSVNAAIVQACYEESIEPHKVAKISGIGCSSKAPAYFMNQSHGFNSVHGRMPSVVTGANLANKDLTYLGISGDGDTASIGVGQFLHVMRRNLNMTYIVYNNGCYGLTKGQDSSTADINSTNKSGIPNMFQPIDLVDIALTLKATFVARSFSGDKAQLMLLIRAALHHPGFAFIDVISPCVTFNNTSKSTKSYTYVREHMQNFGEFDFVPEQEEITMDYDQGEVVDIPMHDGSVIKFNKLKYDHDPRNYDEATKALHDARSKDEILTGLIYIDPNANDTHTMLNTSDVPLNKLTKEDLCPSSIFLDDINKSSR